MSGSLSRPQETDMKIVVISGTGLIAKGRLTAQFRLNVAVFAA